MIHLHLHTTFSFLDGYGKPDQYISRAKEVGQTSFAITDHGNIFGIRTFHQECLKNGINLIPGCELYVKNKTGKYYHLTALAKNNEGYQNLCRLITLGSKVENFDGKPMVPLKDIIHHQEGLIILTGCFGDGMIHRQYQADKERCLTVLRALKREFKDLYLEIQHTGTADEMRFFRLLGEMAGVKTVATADCHYPRKEDYHCEDVMFCIGTKRLYHDKTRIKLTDNLWMMDDKEMLEHGFLQSEIDATHEIADRCKVTFPKMTPIQLPHAREDMIEMARKQAHRLGETIKNETYRRRWNYELDVIDKLGLHSYFVIMGDVINEFKARGMFIGPARGSAGGSLIAYIMGITEVDPIRYSLSFERFIDINRRDYPDIDTDFPSESREAIVCYLSDKYGRDSVGRITSYTTYRGGSTFWDIARIYCIDRKLSAQIGKEIPNLVNDSIDMEQILQMPGVANVVSKYPQFEVAQGLEGQIRQLGKHASGYAISPVPITDNIGFYRMNDELVISADKEQAESMGLIKLDILSLGTLDMIEKIMKDSGVTNEFLYRLDPTDDKVFELFNRGEVSGIFQFEGAAVRRVLQQFTVSSLEDLAFINAVSRPGASNALRGLSIPEPVRKFIYKEKYFVFQEELMAILRWLEFSWDDVTKVRKMVSKKQVTQLDSKYKEPFISALSKHCAEPEARNFWETIKRCGEYMFNKSHAIAYSMLGYVSMWLKLNHREKFVQHYMDMANDPERREMIRECLRMDWTYQISNPERTSAGFQVINRTVVGGLQSIKGIGPAKAENIMRGKMDRGSARAIESAAMNPEKYAPWACMDEFNNRYKLGSLPEGEFMIRARAWSVKDGKALIEDINGCEKAYFNPQFVKITEGEVYDFAITKFKYAKIDSARKIE